MRLRRSSGYRNKSRKATRLYDDNNKRERISRRDTRGYNTPTPPSRVVHPRETLIYESDERDDYIPPLSRASFQARNPIPFLLLIHSVHYHPLISSRIITGDGYSIATLRANLALLSFAHYVFNPMDESQRERRKNKGIL